MEFRYYCRIRHFFACRGLNLYRRKILLRYQWCKLLVLSWPTNTAKVILELDTMEETSRFFFRRFFFWGIYILLLFSSCPFLRLLFIFQDLLYILLMFIHSGTLTWPSPCVKSVHWKLFIWIPQSGEVFALNIWLVSAARQTVLILIYFHPVLLGLHVSQIFT